MEIKKLEKNVSWFQRFNFELGYFIVLNIMLIAVDIPLIHSFWELSEVVILGLIILLMLRNKSRIIYKIEFDDLDQKMNMYYYQFIFFRFSISIPYSQLNFKYLKQSYGIGNLMYALVFLNRKKNVAEINEKSRGGWSKNEIDNIKYNLNIIKNTTANN